jgi:4-amino-4-deoxy-L-arabinose transferase-like glycosyltransferase
MTRRLILALILVVYFILGALFAVNTPPWQAPDEPAHYNYIAYVAQNGSFPVLHSGDYPHGYLEQIKAAGFPPDMSITSIRYESHQPPLYYLLAAPVYSAAGGGLVPLRLLSVLLGAGIVLFAYGIGRRAVPGDPRIALGTAAFVAFLPQHLATISQVGNDVLAELLLAAVIFVSAGLINKPGVSNKPGLSASESPLPLRTYLLLGLLLGLILITKTTAYVGVPVALGVVAWRWLQERPPFRRILLEAAAVILPAALIALPWYARDIYAYGWPDFLGLMRHGQIVVGQPRTADFINKNGWNAYWYRTAEWTFKSFVGVFGWMGVWLDSRVYYLLGLWLAIPAVAWLVSKIPAAQGRSGNSPATSEVAGSARVFALLGISALLTLLTYIYYNITFLQHQGRYLFTALIPIAVFLALGWRWVFVPRPGRIAAIVLAVWSVLLAAWGVLTGHGLPKWPILISIVVAVGIVAAGFLPARARRWAYAAPYALLPLAALYALFGAIVPALPRF